ncbi:helix-turn-helix domain-containing protein [Pseudomonas nitroreducens]|uniref:helix-turn-helix domain-containing protein n=1 Tax=Pseudomonas nitroreducens TaxID=46680 RepID=UPI00265AF96C|nr:XRE family transcriptional regulator [Pseudomonas nitroreducens]MCP1652727.1 putative XRE-type DNA-binding protein [Pseudomonas nitroreducens]
MTDSQRFGSVWDAIEDTPEQAANMRLRSALMMAVMDRVNTWDGTTAERAKRLGITVPRFSNLKRGKIEAFSLDALVSLADAAGLAMSWAISDKAA